MDKEIVLGMFFAVTLLFGGGFAIGYHTAHSDLVVEAYSAEIGKQASWYVTE